MAERLQPDICVIGAGSGGLSVAAAAAAFGVSAVVVGDGFEIAARRFVIATGSSPSLPPIAGLEAVPYLTNETVFDLTSRPQHLIVIGAGAIGLELAQAFRRLGAAVTVIEAAQPLAREDGECAAIVLDALAREGVDVRSNVAVARVEGLGSKVKVVVGGDGEQAIE